jgi:hypothetical protein
MSPRECEANRRTDRQRCLGTARDRQQHKDAKHQQRSPHVA